MFWVTLLFAVILTELLTEFVIKSVVFKPVRDRIKGLHKYLAALFSCGYCFSVWSSYGVVLLLGLVYNFTGWYWADLTLTGLVVHRLSNYLHNFNDKHLDKYYDVRYVSSGSDDPEEND